MRFLFFVLVALVDMSACSVSVVASPVIVNVHVANTVGDTSSDQQNPYTATATSTPRALRSASVVSVQAAQKQALSELENEKVMAIMQKERVNKQEGLRLAAEEAAEESAAEANKEQEKVQLADKRLVRATGKLKEARAEEHAASTETEKLKVAIEKLKVKLSDAEAEAKAAAEKAAVKEKANCNQDMNQDTGQLKKDLANAVSSQSDKGRNYLPAELKSMGSSAARSGKGDASTDMASTEIQWPAEIFKMTPALMGGIQIIVENTNQPNKTKEKVTTGPVAPLKPIFIKDAKARVFGEWLSRRNPTMRACDDQTPLRLCSEQATTTWASEVMSEKPPKDVGFQQKKTPVMPNQMLGGSLSPTLNGTATAFVHDGSAWSGSLIGGMHGGLPEMYHEPPWFPVDANDQNKCDFEHTNAAVKFVQQSRIYALDMTKGTVKPAYTRTWRTGEYSGHGENVPRNIVSVYPLVTAGMCELYIYSRSFQVQKKCRAAFDSTTSNALKNRYFMGCYLSDEKLRGNAKEKCLASDKNFTSAGCMPVGGDRQCQLVTSLVPNSIKFKTVPFDCCVEVHHHVEKLPCESPQSHDVTMSSKLDAASENKRNGVTVLKLGSTKEDPLSVLVTPAFKGPIQNEVYSGKQLTNSLQSGQIYKAAWGSHGPQSYPWNYGSDAAKQFINHVRRRNSVMEPGWSPPYWDFLSPNMGMVVSADSIFVLGGSPLSLKQYSRLPGADGHHSLTNTFMEKLCFPACVDLDKKCLKCPADAIMSRGTEPKTKPMMWTSWDGRNVQNKVPYWAYNWYHRDFQKSSMWHRDIPTVSIAPISIFGDLVGNQWHSNQAQWAGGALTLDANATNGNALRVYGLSHCGTLFLAEPDKQRSVVLFHFLMTEPHVEAAMERVQGTLAVQRYDTPVGQISKLFVSISTKPPSARWRVSKDLPATGSPEYVAKSKIYVVHINAHLQCRKLNTEGGWNSQCKAGKRPCTVPFEASWIQIKGDNPHPNSVIPCNHTLELLVETSEARSLVYGQGALWWYGGNTGMEVKRMALDKAIPCEAFERIMASKVKHWCTDKARCAAHHEGSVLLREDHLLQPWSLSVYRKNSLDKAGLSKVLLCSRPSLPTTRHSPEHCCAQKDNKAGAASREDLLLW